MMYIEFIKPSLIKDLPEKKSSIVFIQPDVLILFNVQKSFVIWSDILNKLNSKWREQLDLWPAELDFRKDWENESEIDKLLDSYFSVDFGNIPEVIFDNIKDSDIQFPFVFDENKNLYVNLDFLKDLKSCGAEDIWYDSTHPYGRY